jgi:hypothetical protein
VHLWAHDKLIARFLSRSDLAEYLKLLQTDDDPPVAKKPVFKYGPDIPQSLFKTLDKENPWNLNRFPGCILREEIPQWLDLADPEPKFLASPLASATLGRPDRFSSFILKTAILWR